MDTAQIQPRAVSQAEQIRFENQGFLHLRQLMDPLVTLRVREAYQRVQNEQITPRLGQRSSHYDVQRLLDADSVFSEIAVLPKLLPYLLSTVGEDVQLIQANARLFPPGKTPTAPWHSDMANTLGIDLSHSPNFHIKVHFYFEDLQPDQGCLAFLPGTHRRPHQLDRPRPQDIVAERDSEIIVPRAGDAVLFNTHCLHMCLDNKTLVDRRTLIYAYSHFWVKQYDSAILRNPAWIPTDTLSRQVFGLGIEGLDMFDQRPWGEERVSRLDRLRRRIGRRMLREKVSQPFA